MRSSRAKILPVFIVTVEEVLKDVLRFRGIRDKRRAIEGTIEIIEKFRKEFNANVPRIKIYLIREPTKVRYIASEKKWILKFRTQILILDGILACKKKDLLDKIRKVLMVRIRKFLKEFRKSEKLFRDFGRNPNHRMEGKSFGSPSGALK